MFERLLRLRNDVGLLSEEWDPAAQRQLGNTPQAFSHFALVVSALQLHMRRMARSDNPAASGSSYWSSPTPRDARTHRTARAPTCGFSTWRSS